MKASCVVVGLFALLSVGCGQPASPNGPSLVGPGHPSSDSQAAELPFKGDLEGTQSVTPLDPPFGQVTGQATGQATHLGKFAVQFPHIVNFDTSTGVGTYTFTAANGDTLTADFTGEAQPGPITSIVEDAVITGGTGRFAGATGSFTVRRLLDRGAGTTTGSFTGTLSLARGPA